MGIETWIAIGVIALVVGLAAAYIIKSKRNGKKCVGCPETNCPGHCHCDHKTK